MAPAMADMALGSTELHDVQAEELTAEEKVPATHMVQEIGSAAPIAAA